MFLLDWTQSTPSKPPESTQEMAKGIKLNCFDCQHVAATWSDLLFHVHINHKNNKTPGRDAKGSSSSNFDRPTYFQCKSCHFHGFSGIEMMKHFAAHHIGTQLSGKTGWNSSCVNFYRYGLVGLVSGLKDMGEWFMLWERVYFWGKGVVCACFFTLMTSYQCSFVGRLSEKKALTPRPFRQVHNHHTGKSEHSCWTLKNWT